MISRHYQLLTSGLLDFFRYLRTLSSKNSKDRGDKTSVVPGVGKTQLHLVMKAQRSVWPLGGSVSPGPCSSWAAWGRAKETFLNTGNSQKDTEPWSEEGCERNSRNAGYQKSGSISRVGFAETLKLYTPRGWSCLKEGEFLSPSYFLIKSFMAVFLSFSKKSSWDEGFIFRRKFQDEPMYTLGMLSESKTWWLEDIFLKD